MEISIKFESYFSKLKDQQINLFLCGPPRGEGGETKNLAPKISDVGPKYSVDIP